MDDTHLITLLSGFCFDFTHMFAPGGLKDEELDALFLSCRRLKKVFPIFAGKAGPIIIFQRWSS